MSEASKSKDPQSGGAERAALDMARGVVLVLALLALIPGNALRWATPEAFGHSGMAELFLFLAGLAIAPELLRVFDAGGAGRGALRSLHRAWQLYWRYLGAVLTAGALTLWISNADPATALAPINLDGFLIAPGEALLGIATLTLRPDFFALPAVYTLILIAAPLLIHVARWRLEVGAALLALLYAAGQVVALGDGLNPLAWATPFMVGFAFGAGWLRAPSPSALWVTLAAATLLLSAATDPDGAIGGLWRSGESMLEAEATLGPIRLLHAAALVYLVSALLHRADAVTVARLGGIGRALQKIGGQSVVGLVALHPIAATVAALFLAETSNPVAPLTSSLLASVTAVVLLAIATEIALWFEDPPWNRRPTAPAV